MSASLTRLRSFYGELKTSLLLHALIRREFTGSIAVSVSYSLTAKSLLTLVAAIDPTTPVLWLDDGSHHDNTPEKLELTTITHAATQAEIDELIEDKAFLAIISATIPPNKERILLDAGGVFRIYPYAPQTQQAQDARGNSDWSV